MSSMFLRRLFMNHVERTNNFVGASARLAIELVPSQIGIVTAIDKVI